MPAWPRSPCCWCRPYIAPQPHAAAPHPQSALPNIVQQCFKNVVPSSAEVHRQILQLTCQAKLAAGASTAAAGAAGLRFPRAATSRELRRYRTCVRICAESYGVFRNFQGAARSKAGKKMSIRMARSTFFPLSHAPTSALLYPLPFPLSSPSLSHSLHLKHAGKRLTVLVSLEKRQGDHMGAKVWLLFLFCSLLSSLGARRSRALPLPFASCGMPLIVLDSARAAEENERRWTEMLVLVASTTFSSWALSLSLSFSLALPP